MDLEDMTSFARVAEARSFTGAARELGIPKQTLSRRIARLESELGVQLLHRTTRSVRPTELGAAYAERCAEIVRLAEDAARALADRDPIPRGTLRVTADPAFGEAFLGALVIDYARRHPETRVELHLLRRRVDLVDEGFDVAFRVGQVDDPQLVGRRLGPARIRYCAAPAYLAERGTPRRAEDLREHACVLISDAPPRWPFRGGKTIAVDGRVRVNSAALARDAVLAGLGVGLFAEYACAEDVAKKRLVPVIEREPLEVGAIWLVHPAQRSLVARVRAFVDLATERFAKVPPWSVGLAKPAAVRHPRAR